MSGKTTISREVPVDGRLPEQASTVDDPTTVAERPADVELAVWLLLERLSPRERAVFVLREAFDHPFREIADTLAISEAYARQLVRRARAHLPITPVTCDGGDRRVAGLP